MATTPSHDGEGELFVKPSCLRFGGDVHVAMPERTEKLENEEEGVMENMLGQSMHGHHDGKVRFSIRGLDGPRNSHGMVIKKARFTPSRRSCELDTRPAAELGPSKAPLKVLRGPPIPILFCMVIGPSNDAGEICAQKQCTYTIM